MSRSPSSLNWHIPGFMFLLMRRYFQIPGAVRTRRFVRMTKKNRQGERMFAFIVLLTSTLFGPMEVSSQVGNSESWSNLTYVAFGDSTASGLGANAGGGYVDGIFA